MKTCNLRRPAIALRTAEIVATVLLLALGGATPGHTETYTVTNTNNSGAGSLRQAILDANANAGTDYIHFSIPGIGPHTIQPSSALHTITDPVIIDGWTQGGAGYTGPPLIELDGSAAGTGAIGLYIFSADDCVVRGLVINSFSSRGIDVFHSGGVVIEGNYIGTDVSGSISLPNRRGVELYASDNCTIGGATSEVRNIISGNTLSGVLLSGSETTGNVVQGNYIGTDVTGTVDLGNDYGVSISGPDNIIGGTTDGSGNVISGNTWDGVYIFTDATGNIVQGNCIGTDATGTAPMGNGVHGVYIYNNASDNSIGGYGSYADNTVAHNGGDGICATSGTGNAVLSNSIFANGGLGIDLGNDGVTPNDPGDGDTGPNNLQNFPVLTSALFSGDDVIVTGTLDTGVPSDFFTLCLFYNSALDPSGHGEGETCGRVAQVETSPSGDASFTLSFPIPESRCMFITATATDPWDNTSEFSEAVTVSLDLSGEIEGVYLMLDWSDVPEAMEYWVYGAANEAYFPIQEQYRVTLLPGIYSWWTSSNGVGDPDNNWTYLVIALDLSGQELCRSNRYGEHDFEGDIP